MIHFINYSSNGFKNSQIQAIEIAKSYGFSTQPFSDKDLEEEFKIKNKNILEQKRGAGYWLWKPYIINKKLKEIPKDDYLIYMDSGACFVRNPQIFIEMIDKRGILLFDMIQKMSRWTKGDCFFKLTEFKDISVYKEKNQIQATYIFLKKCDFSLSFIEKWLNKCEDEDLITDKKNVYMENSQDFIDHRHDQSILSLLAFKENINVIPQIDQYCVEHGYTQEERMYVNRHGNRN